MNTVLLIIAILLFMVLVYLGYRHYSLQRALNNYVQSIRTATTAQLPPKDVRSLEDLSNAINALFSNINFQLSTSEAERSRLATVLDQMTDGVLIVDSVGKIEFANPAAERLFASPRAVNHSVVEVVRNHQLADAWRRCQQTREMQTESVELPARRQFLQMIAIPDMHDSGSILLVQDLTRVRKLETVRRDFISNVSHELRTPLASLKALTETLQDGALSDPEAGPRSEDSSQPRRESVAARRAPTASLRAVHAVGRSRLRTEGRRRDRPVRQSAGPCGRLRRR